MSNPSAEQDLPELVAGSADDLALARKVRSALRVALSQWLARWDTGGAALCDEVAEIGSVCEHALDRNTDARFWIDRAHMPLLALLAVVFSEQESARVGELVDKLRASDEDRTAAWMHSADSRSPEVLLGLDDRHSPESD
jgi:hypothetical protein